jgi:hypothetical protein
MRAPSTLLSDEQVDARQVTPNTHEQLLKDLIYSPVIQRVWPIEQMTKVYGFLSWNGWFNRPPASLVPGHSQRVLAYKLLLVNN